MNPIKQITDSLEAAPESRGSFRATWIQDD